MRLPSIIAAKSKLRLLHALGIKETTVSIGGDSLELRVNTRDYLSEQLACHRYFEPRVREELLSRLKPGMTVLDIGANIGYYTALAAVRVGPGGRVISMEPQPQVCRRLRDNIRRNGLTNVHVVEAAAGAANDKTIFHVPVAGWEAHGSCRVNKSFTSAGTIEVSLRRVDDILAELRVPAVDLIKIDVEGAEWDAFKGMPQLISATSRPTLIFEACEDYTSVFGHSVYELLHWLNHQGYRVSQLEENNWLAQSA